MNEQDFVNLVKSIQLAGKIKRGLQKPGRLRIVTKDKQISKRHERWLLKLMAKS